MSTMEEFFGAPISVYTDAQALEDGALVATSGLFPAAWRINRITRAVFSRYTRKLLGGAMTDVTILVRAVRAAWEGARIDRDWRIGQTPDGETIWFVPNEVGSYTALFPDDY